MPRFAGADLGVVGIRPAEPRRTPRNDATLGCRGLTRVDFFLADDGTVYVNELNTLPGFTNISMYPKLWREEGISYSQLIEKLIEAAFGAFEEEK